MSTKTIKAWIDGAIQEIEVEDIVSPEQPLSPEERLDILEDKPVITDGNLLVGNGTEDLEEMTPEEVLSHINGASVLTMTTEEYEALEDANSNANTLYLLTDSEEKVVGQVTENGGEIFNDYDTNKALSAYSTVRGYNNTAGVLGFCVNSIIDDRENTGTLIIELTFNEEAIPQFGATVGTDIITNIDEYYPTLQDEEGNYLYSISIHSTGGKYWIDCARIISYDNTTGQIVVTTDGFKNIGNLFPDDLTNFSATYRVCTPYYPDKGVISFASFAQASGHSTIAGGSCSSAEGYLTRAIANYAHAEGMYTEAKAQRSHAEGTGSIAHGTAAHAEGDYTKAMNTGAHSEGSHTEAIGLFSHAEGNTSIAEGQSAHAEGENTRANAKGTHAEGNNTLADKDYAHAEGSKTEAHGTSSHAEGSGTATGGEGGLISGQVASSAHAEGNATRAYGNYSHAEGNATYAEGSASHAEGKGTHANAHFTHAEGNATTASGSAAHAEGSSTIAKGEASHAEGRGTQANSNYSHAEGQNTIASGNSAHAEGFATEAGHNAHAEGNNSKALNSYAHAEGYYTTASGQSSHAEGDNTTASGKNSHAGGMGTIASEVAQTAIGKYNSEDSNALFIVGKGEDDNSRSNAFTVNKDGTATLAKVGENNNNVATVGYVKANNGSSVGRPTKVTGGEIFNSYSSWNANTASGQYAHAEGLSTHANGFASHAAGIVTGTSAAGQTVVGIANVRDDDALFIVGNGSYSITTDEHEDGTCENIYDVGKMSNAFTVNKDGNTYTQGDAYVRGTGETKKKLATEEYVENKVAGLSSITATDDGTGIITLSFTSAMPAAEEVEF